MRRVWLVVLCACGRIDFDARTDAKDGTSARCDWTAGPTFGPITRHSTLDSLEYEYDPILVRGDPLTIYLGAGDPQDIYTATRPSVDAPFGARTPVAELNTPATDTALAVDTSGVGYMIRGTTPGINLVEVQRVNGTFSVVRELTELDGGTNEYDPWVSPDGLELWFTEDTGDQNIFVATRATTSDLWGNPLPFVHNTATIEGNATLTADRLVVVWTLVEPGSIHMRYATRASINDPWGAPQTFPFAATQETEPSLRDDGCELFFCTAPASNAQWDTASVTITSR